MSIFYHLHLLSTFSIFIKNFHILICYSSHLCIVYLFDLKKIQLFICMIHVFVLIMISMFVFV